MGILKVKRISTLMFVSLTVMSCWPTRDLRNFTLYRETKQVDSDKLKINGIYYAIQKKENYKERSNDYVNCFVLFENGTYLDLSSNEIKISADSSVNLLVSHYANRQAYLAAAISQWGAFKVVKDTLFIQRYHHLVMPKSGIIAFTSKVFDYKMKILNDTTLVEIDKSTGVHGEDKFYLYETNNKPDSTNLFMTNKRIKRKLDRLYEKRHRKDNQ